MKRKLSSNAGRKQSIQNSKAFLKTLSIICSKKRKRAIVVMLGMNISRMSEGETVLQDETQEAISVQLC